MKTKQTGSCKAEMPVLSLEAFVCFSLLLCVAVVGAGAPLRAQAPPPRFAYVANYTSHNVSAYTINATTGTLTPIAGSPFPAVGGPVSVTTTAGPRFGDLVTLGCGLESTLRSVESVTPISVQFLNASAEVRKVYELNLAGERELRISSLAPGMANVQATFLTHPWVVTDVDNQCVAIYRPAITRAVIRQ